MQLIDVPLEISNDYSEEESIDKKNDFELNLFKAKYGKKNVERISSKTIKVKVNNQAYAINALEYDDWKFIEKKDGYEMIIEKIIPKKIIKKLK